MKHVREILEILDTSTIVRYPTTRYDISNLSHTNPPLHADAIAELLVSIPPRGEDRGVLFFKRFFAWADVRNAKPKDLWSGRYPLKLYVQCWSCIYDICIYTCI